MPLRPGQSNLQTFKPGQSGNPAGRPKGSKNRFSKKVKDELKKIMGEFFTFKSLREDLAAMEPKDRVSAMNSYLKYFLTTTKEVKTTHQGNVQVKVNYEQKPLEKLEDIQDTDDFIIE